MYDIPNNTVIYIEHTVLDLATIDTEISADRRMAHTVSQPTTRDVFRLYASIPIYELKSNTMLYYYNVSTYTIFRKQVGG